MNELAIAIRCYKKDTYIEIIDNIKKAGFKNVFIEWYNDDLTLQKNILDYVRKQNLNIIFAHLGYQRPNVLWNHGIEGDIETERYINDIKQCKENGIDLVVIHPTFQYEKQEKNEIGINRIKKILKEAEELDVKVAFENVELSGYLEYILSNIESENLGICFDVGHYHLFYNDEFNTEKFKNRTWMIHLHDNYGKTDEHNLPFDGNVNWEKAISQICELNYKGYVVIESGRNIMYKNLSFEEYYNLAYERGKKLLEIIKRK